MADSFEQWKEQCFSEEIQIATESPTESNRPLSVRIFEYCSGLFLYGCYFAFCWFHLSNVHTTMLEIKAGTVDPKLLQGFGQLLVFMTGTFGPWPSSLIFFAVLQIPVGLMCWQIWGPKHAEVADDELPVDETWIPRFDKHTANKVLFWALLLFYAATSSLLFKLSNR